MNRTHFIKIFILLALCTTFILAFSRVGSKAFEAYTVSSQTFNQGTMIGSIDVSGMTKEEAISIVTSQVEQWKTAAQIEITMRENKKLFDSKYLTFYILESIELAKDGQQNSLHVQVDTVEFQNAIIQLAPEITELDKLEEDLLVNVQTLNTIQIKLEDYLSEKIEVETVGTVQVPLELTLPSNPIEMPIPKGSSFSVTAILDELNVSGESTSNYFSSAIYQLILKSNFKIIERHIGTDLPADIPLGFEAKIDRDLGWDLVFYNPNHDDFTLQITHQNGTVTLELLGYHFSNIYEIELDNQQTFPPKIIRQFDSQLTPGQSKESFSGKNGSYVEVIRKAISGNQEAGRELISKDYYPPQHKIILVGQ